MKIFISGGTGFVGGHVQKELLDRGHRLMLLVHRRSDRLLPGIEQVEGDVTRPETFAGRVSGCDAVINLVGIIREFPSRGVTFQRLHMEGTKNMVDAAQQAGIGRYLQMSALGVREGAVSAYQRSKYQAEQYVRKSGLDFTIFRPSIIFGPKDDFINKLAGMIRNLPVVPVIGDGTYRLQPIAADDVARCFAMALEMPETIGKTFELCGPTRISYNELLDTISRVTGKANPTKIHNPLGLVKLVVPLFQNIPAFPITMDQLLMLIEDNICDGAWRDTFRFEPQDLEEGIRRYLQ
ncbi:complex I NDUFA9 subunit family protein [Geotalea sp. SG265]|uniref:complex I NDUFA9 subunit family protein n=1 Tax=Geotalea sp. SG265 TaxID=2922867 RepID=UPI001FAEB913|nr:complex I NDUFA9 subunit family protein [Geotalea sp. SG265]